MQMEVEVKTTTQHFTQMPFTAGHLLLLLIILYVYIKNFHGNYFFYYILLQNGKVYCDNHYLTIKLQFTIFYFIFKKIIVRLI